MEKPLDSIDFYMRDLAPNLLADSLALTLTKHSN